MSSKSLVSVILIFLNGEKFIREAISSVFAQTYDNWELILVDDGSTDSATEIARWYAKQHPAKVQYLEHEGHQNKGMSASRNLGVSIAKGEYVAFLDADDVWLPYKLEQQVAILESCPEAAMVYGRALKWYGWTGNQKDIKRDSAQKELGVQPDTLVKPPKLLLVLLRNFAVPSPSAVLVRHQVIKDVGGFEEAFRGNFEDQVFYSKICIRAPVFVSGQCWHKYRYHPDSHNAFLIRTGQYFSYRLRLLNWEEDYLSGLGFTNGEVWKVLQTELWPYRHPVLYRLFKTGRYAKSVLKFLGRQTLPIPTRRWLRVQWEWYRRRRVAA